MSGVALGTALMVAVGAQLAPQAPINRQLGEISGGVTAALVSLLGSALLAVGVCLASGDLGRLAGATDVPPELLLGGVLGAGFVLSALLCVGAIGAGGVAAAAVTGQLIASLALDAGGALGLERRPLSAATAVGTLAVLTGTLLILPGAGREVARPRPGTLLPALVVVCGGAMMGVQHPINGELADSIGSPPAALANFLVGAAALAVVALACGQLAGLRHLHRARWYQLSGGLYGGVNAGVALVMVGRIGAGAVAAATVTGQMIASLALDRAGLLGLRRHAVTPRRLLGAVALIAGTSLVAIG